MNLTIDDIDVLEDWWVKKSRVNFLAYRQYMRYGMFEYNWFIADLCKQFQQFYLDYIAGLRPVLLVQSPPQHGKSWAVADLIAWMSGKVPQLKSIYASYSATLGVRCNLSQQRQMDNPKYGKIFPGTQLSRKKGGAMRNTEYLEFIGEDDLVTSGQFRNTTCGGGVTGESLDLGVIDDAVKGREQANSITWSQKVWEWFTDDYGTRFSDKAGLIIIMTRWTVHDIIGRFIEMADEIERKYTLVNYPALAIEDEVYRKVDDPLFPELKSKEFLVYRKAVMAESSFESLYQGSPTIAGGNMVKDTWWEWWKTDHLPPIEYKFITADTAQKTKETSDWSVFQAWGMGVRPDRRIYLLDKKREKLTAPQLRREAVMFYNKHNTKRENVGDPVLRKMYIEDKSSGTGLIQELKEKGLKIEEVGRDKDKERRCKDSSPEIEAGRVVLNTDIDDMANTTKEAREFPESKFDDDFDTLMQAIEVAFLNASGGSYLEEAMAA